MAISGIDLGTSEDKTSMAVYGVSVIAPPERAGNVVGITEFNGMLIVACKNGVFSYRDGEFHPIRFTKEG